MKEDPSSTPNEKQRDSSSPNDGLPPSKVRGRTLQHLRKMLAKAGATGAAVCMSGCIGCDPAPRPIDCTTDITSSILQDPWIFRWHAQWTQTEEQPHILVEIDLYNTDPRMTFPGDLTLEGATLFESDIAESSMTFTCTPLEDATSVTISLLVQCEETTHTLNLIMDVSGTPALGESVPISAEE